VAVAVSGGADSLCLALLTRGWGDPIALIVDHGLRPDSREEAGHAASTLANCAIPSRVLSLRGLTPGPGLASRARSARYNALGAAARALGLSDLLLGHHAGDQAETLLIRREDDSGVAGLAGMAAVAETADLRLVRPLLGVPPGRLRATLRAAGIAWAEDPSNRDATATRTRMRVHLAEPGGDGPATMALLQEARAFACQRAAIEADVAAFLAGQANLFPEGYAILTPGPIASAPLASLIRMLGGAPYPPSRRAVLRLAEALASGPVSATLGGVRLMPAGRLGPGTLLAREAEAVQPPVPATPGILWDGRFKLAKEPGAELPAGMTIGALGNESKKFRRLSALPAAVLCTLPALRGVHGLVAVPHLRYFKQWTNRGVRLRLLPASIASGASFLAFCQGDAQTPGEHHVPR